MKITFLIPNVNLSGGVRVVAIYADWLARHGHDVTVVAGRPVERSLVRKLRSFLRSGKWPRSGGDPTYFLGMHARLIELEAARPIVETDVPDGDIVIATWWTTAEDAAKLSPAKGRKVYFLQHYEIHQGLPKERVKETWRLPFAKVVVSDWLKNIAENEFGDTDVTVVPNGVDLQLFSSPPRGRQSRPTVGTVYSAGTPFKGTDIVLDAFEIARKRMPGLNLVSFGSQTPNSDVPLPRDAEFHLRPPQVRIRDIYGKCDVWLFGSRSEGFGLPILEAMACRTPVIGTPAGAAPELLADGCGIIVPPEDPVAMADAIIDFFTMTEDRWREMSDAAFMEASRHDWAASCRGFEKALNAALEAS